MYKFVIQYFKKHIVKVIMLVILSLIISSINIINPYIISKYMDLLISNSQNLNISKFIFIVIIIYSLDMGVKYIKNIIMISLCNKTSFDMIYNIFEHIKRIPIENLRNMDMVYLNQRISTDTNEVIMFVLDNILNIVLNAISIIIVCIYILNINLKVGLILFSTIPMYFAIYFCNKNKLFLYNKEVKEAQSIYFSQLTDQLKNIRMIKLNSCFKFFSELMKNSFNEFYKINFKYSICNSNFNILGTVISNISNLLLFILGFYQIIQGNMTVGGFLAINNLFPLLVGKIDYFFSLGSSYQKASSSFYRIREILVLDEELNGFKNIKKIELIECKNVSYSFGEKVIIKNFNNKFKKGNIYKLCGENGKGKTTLINIICGIYQKYNGEIFYNELNTKELNMYNVRKLYISVSEQEPELLSDTILNNIVLGDKNVTEQCIFKYMDIFNVDHSKLEYIVSKDNINLSGGEKQKISIIKCLCKNSDFIIFDEPTSALDTQSSNILKSLLVELKKDKIIILIAHGEFGCDIADEQIII
ncbi:ABC transporter ATP-binding protein [Clostridium sp.]|uniref:ABC transporter ATP-binding protein n=1 Tax=Clostridium sp. TaxID=1506 RepID=UPI003216AAB5